MTEINYGNVTGTGNVLPFTPKSLPNEHADMLPCDVEPRHDNNTDVNPNEGKVTVNPSARDRFLQRLGDLMIQAHNIATAKNADYTGGNDDPFANFAMAPLVAGVSVERGMLVRMSDKMIRISNLLDRDAHVADESLLDTLSDLANYALILRIWLEWKRGE